jgi:hypothetical protein
MVDSIAGDGTQTVTVTTPCKCGAKRWFQCRCATVIAEYDVTVFDTVPLQSHIAYIQALHPGMTLIY